MRRQPLSWVNDSMRHIVFTTFSFSHRGRVAESSVNVPVFHVDNELCKQCTVVVLTVTEPGKYALPVKNDRWRLWNWAYTLKYITSWFQASVFAWVWHVCRGVGSLNVFFFFKKEGLGWALFFASLSSLEVECLSPPSPLYELLALGQVTKQDSITGRWNPKWPRLPPYVCMWMCVSARLSPVPVIYPIP